MKCKKGYKQKGSKCVKKKSFAKVFSSSSNYGWIFWILGILIIVGVFWYGGTHDWFKGIYSQSYSVVSGDINNFLTNQEASPSSECSLDLNPNSINKGDRVTGTLQDGANTLCYLLANDGTGWKIVYETTTDANGFASDTRNIDFAGTFVFRAICDKNHNNQMDSADCLTNAETLVVLDTTSSCVDSDGDNINTPGWVTTSTDTYYDKCLDVGQAVTEYTCESGLVVSKNWMCDYGEVCIATRSGGYCAPADSGYEVGDIIGTFPGTGSISGTAGINDVINLIGVELGGDCSLGARIHTGWTYANEKCSGIMGAQGMEWLFSDSSGVRWSTVDTTPRTHDEDLCPLSWDGQTNWKISAYPISSNLPECILNYNYNVEVYVCECP